MKPFEKKNKKHGMRLFVFVLLVIVAILCVAAAGIYTGVSERTVTNISGVYLQEMTAQIRSHFQTNLDSQFSQIRTITNALAENDLRDEESLRHFLEQAQASNAFPPTLRSSATGGSPIRPKARPRQCRKFPAWTPC